MSNNESHKIVKEFIEVIRTNKYKNIKWRCEIKNKLNIFTYYLNLFLTLNYTIKFFYQMH